MPIQSHVSRPAGAIPIVDAGGHAISDVNFSWDAVDALLKIMGGEWLTGPHGEVMKLVWAEELLTLSTGGATTDTTANLLPANSLILCVVGRVTTTIVTATDWKLGDPTSAGRFTAADSTLTAGESVVGIVQWSGAITTLALGPSQPAAAKVRVTTTGTPSAGVVEIGVLALTFSAETS